MPTQAGHGPQGGEYGQSGRLKGEESVTPGIIPAADGKEPRFLLKGAEIGPSFA
jgi:hypothetical protein